MDDKVRIDSFFKVYSEGDYQPYEGMYTNLSLKNVILAARVGDRVLTEKELVEWFQTECHGREEELIEKLNLHYGPREAEFNFGERTVKEELHTAHSDVVAHFQEARETIQEELTLYSLVLESKKFGEKEAPTDKEIADFQNVTRILKNYASDEIIAETESLSVEELKDRISRLQEQELEIYSGKNLSLLQESYGISEEEVENAIRAKLERETPLEQPARKSAVSKKTHNAMMASFLKSHMENPEIKNAIVHDEALTDEEIEALTKVGVSRDLIDTYQTAVQNGTTKYTPEQLAARRKNRIDQKRKDLEKDPDLLRAAKEEAAATILFPEVTEEEVTSLLGEKHHLDVLNAQREGKEAPEERKVEDLSKEERERIEQEVRRVKLRKAQAEVTIGIENQERIRQITEKITKEPREDYSCARFIYGNDWFICVDAEGKIMDEYVAESVLPDSLSRRIYEEARSEFQGKEEIKSGQVEETTKGVSKKEKQKAVKTLADGNRQVPVEAPIQANNPNQGEGR